MFKRVFGVSAICAVVAGGSLLPTPANASPRHASSGAFASISPVRVLDTRVGIGAAKVMVAAGHSVAVSVLGLGVVPASGVSAVVLKVTESGATAGGYVTGWADGAPRPGTSSLNFPAQQTVGNLGVVPVGADGRVALYNGSSQPINLIADISGYYVSGTPIGPGTFGPVTPARVLDTRTGTGAAKVMVAAGHSVSVSVLGSAGVPADGVSAVVLNVTESGATARGYVTSWADGEPRPGTSNLNFPANQTVGNLGLVPVGADGKVVLFNGSSQPINLIADISGYYVSGTPTGPGAFGSVTPARVLDTRVGTGAAKLMVAAGHSVTVSVLGSGDVPADGVTAVVLNVTESGATAAGYVTSWADGKARPGTSNLNFPANQTVGNLGAVPVGADGKVVLYNGSSRPINLIADLSGYYVGNGFIGFGGRITSWGSNDVGEIGNGTTGSDVLTPVPGADISDVIQTAGALETGYALTSDGTVWAWGNGVSGELGNGARDSSDVPVQVSDLTGITAIAAFRDGGYALKSDGTVRAWGHDDQDSIGNFSLTTAYVVTPVQVTGLANVVQIAGNGEGGYALESDGRVWSWGSADEGRLGRTSFPSNQSPTYPVSGLTGIRAIAAGEVNGYALATDGTVWAWGYGNDGELGTGPSIANATTPVHITSLSQVVALGAGELSAYVITSGGTVKTWGWNRNGQLGDATTTNRTTPTSIGLTGITAITAGQTTAYAVDASGNVWSWGEGDHGELGSGGISDSSTPTRINGVSNVLHISAAQHTVYAVTAAYFRCATLC